MEAGEAALAALRPARLRSGRREGALRFGWNRRENREVAVTEGEVAAMVHGADSTAPDAKGPSDAALDLLAVEEEEEHAGELGPGGGGGGGGGASGEAGGEAGVAPRVIALVYGYACHCTVLSAQVVHGDWAGCASASLEESHAGAVALFVPGCGGDQNPVYRRHAALARLCAEIAISRDCNLRDGGSLCLSARWTDVCAAHSPLTRVRYGEHAAAAVRSFARGEDGAQLEPISARSPIRCETMSLPLQLAGVEQLRLPCVSPASPPRLPCISPPHLSTASLPRPCRQGGLPTTSSHAWSVTLKVTLCRPCWRRTTTPSSPPPRARRSTRRCCL